MVALLKPDNRIEEPSGRILHGDCLSVLRGLPDNSVDAVVTDPPCGIGFMSAKWDTFDDKTHKSRQAEKDTRTEEGKWLEGRGTLPYGFSPSLGHSKRERENFISFMTEVMQEVLRCLRPGGHAFVWALPRTSHWTATALEDAGFEIRDVITHLQGAGFPKSLNVTKAALNTGMACQCQTNVVYSKEKEEVYHVKTALQASPDLPELQPAILSEEPFGIEQGEVLFRDMLRGMESDQSRNTRATQEDSRQRTGGLVGRNKRSVQAQEYGSQQSGMEGRRNAQEDSRQLSGGEVREVSPRVPGNGTQGRVCDGTSVSDGSASREILRESGSSASPRPQSKQQSHQQPSTIPQQRSSQTCGSCGKTIVPEGLGSALKPSNEHWILCRKPLSESTIAKNVLTWGTGGLAIDASRISHDDRVQCQRGGVGSMFFKDGEYEGKGRQYTAQGRFPSNTLMSHTLMCVERGVKRVKGSHHKQGDVFPRNVVSTFSNPHPGTSGIGYTDEDGMEQVTAWECDPSCPVYQLDLMGKGTRGEKASSSGKGGWRDQYVGGSTPAYLDGPSYKDAGGISRYFAQFHPTEEDIVPFLYCSKASRTERNQGCEGLPEVVKGSNYGMDGPRPHTSPDYHYEAKAQNTHPTVKPLQLMRYLITMITPPDGVVLDPFAGSGSTLVACVQTGHRFIGIEQDASYIAIARSRIAHAEREVLHS